MSESQSGPPSAREDASGDPGGEDGSPVVKSKRPLSISSQIDMLRLQRSNSLSQITRKPSSLLQSLQASGALKAPGEKSVTGQGRMNRVAPVDGEGSPEGEDRAPDGVDGREEALSGRSLFIFSRSNPVRVFLAKVGALALPAVGSSGSSGSSTCVEVAPVWK